MCKYDNDSFIVYSFLILQSRRIVNLGTMVIRSTIRTTYNIQTTATTTNFKPLLGNKVSLNSVALFHRIVRRLIKNQQEVLMIKQICFMKLVRLYLDFPEKNQTRNTASTRTFYFLKICVYMVP